MKQNQSLPDIAFNKTKQHQSKVVQMLIRLLNITGGLLEHLGVSLGRRSEDSLIAAACRKTGLSDWGDESFRIPLSVLLESYRKDANLSFMGWVITHGDIIHRLINRLLIQDSLKQYPDILKTQIRQPLFIVSLPRTGTTLLQCLLSLDSSSRTLLSWEAHRPAPPPNPQTFETDPRIVKVTKMINRMNTVASNLEAIHSVQSHLPAECPTLLENSFAYPSFGGFVNLPQYLNWLETQDMAEVYRYYRQQLQILQFHFPQKRWILKAPMHTLYLDVLVKIFPDACIIQTHRDPTKVVPSACSLTVSVGSIYSDKLDLNIIGKNLTNYLGKMVECGNKARNFIDPSRLLDIHYRDLVQDPIGTVKKIYTYFDYQFTEDFEESMHKWLKANPKNKHGVHRYSLEQFGLNQETVSRSFADYRKQFQIPAE